MDEQEVPTYTLDQEPAMRERLDAVSSGENIRNGFHKLITDKLAGKKKTLMGICLGYQLAFQHFVAGECCPEFMASSLSIRDNAYLRAICGNDDLFKKVKECRKDIISNINDQPTEEEGT